MDLRKLVEKLDFYETSKIELDMKSYEEEIDKEVEAYRETLVQKYEEIRKTDLLKITHYIDLLNDLIKEGEAEEAEKATAESEGDSEGEVEETEKAEG